MPTATTSCPGRKRAESPSAAGTSSGASTRSTARSVCGSSPINVAESSRPSSNRDRDVIGLMNDVTVGEDKTVGRKDEARAVTAMAAGADFDGDDRGANALGGSGHRLRVRV